MEKLFFVNYSGLFYFLSLTFGCSFQKKEPADLILPNGDIYTVNLEHPRAKALVVVGNKIKAVLDSDEEALRWKGQETKVIDLQGAFVIPGIIDAHVHFNRAGVLMNNANLMMLADEVSLRQEIKRGVNLLDEGEGIRYEASSPDQKERLLAALWSPEGGGNLFFPEQKVSDT